MNGLGLVGVALAGSCVGFSLLYGAARRLDNYGIVDIAWSYAFGALAIFYAAAAPGWLVRRALLAAMVVLWSARLGTHLAVRVVRHHPLEDARYGQMRREWGPNLAGRMFGFFLLQAVSVPWLGLPLLLAFRNPAPALHPLEMAGAILWLLAISGEALADAQLASFRREPANHGKVCDRGLWRYSRHPNYFFEWLIWVAYFVFALPSPWGWLGVAGPATILYLLLRVTGIPLTEEQSLRSKGEAYRQYQRRTSAFIPLPRRRRSN